MRKTLILILVLAAMLSLFACGFSPDSPEESSKPGPISTNDKDKEAASQEKEKLLLVDDEAVKAEFVEFTENDDLGLFYVTIRVQNKTDRKVTIYLVEASVNDEMVPLVMSGAPLTILPGKIGANADVFSFAQLSFSKFEDVKTVAFKIDVKDNESFEDIDITEEIVITK